MNSNYKMDFIELMQEVKTPKQKKLVEDILLKYVKHLTAQEYMQMVDEINNAIYKAKKEQKERWY